MAKYQLISCFVALGGNPQNTVYRGVDNPVTYPEALILAAVHGGQEYVHTMVEVGHIERAPQAEMERLTLRYGQPVREHFPTIGGRISLPERDNDLPTLQEVQALHAATSEAKSKLKAARRKGAAPAASPGGVPTLADLSKTKN